MDIRKLNNSSGRTATVFILAIFTFFQLTASSALAAPEEGIELYESELSIILSEEVQEALNSGVRLKFIVASGHRKKLLFFGWTKNDQQQTFEIHHHALSNHYLVRNQDQTMLRSFSSLRMSLDYIKQLCKAFFAQVDDQSVVATFKPAYRVYLDKFSLPTPMRINAFWSSSWDLDSGWQEWE